MPNGRRNIIKIFSILFGELATELEEEAFGFLGLRLDEYSEVPVLELFEFF